MGKFNFKNNNNFDREVPERFLTLGKGALTNFDLAGTTIDIINKYGTALMFKHINDYNNKQLDQRELSPDFESKENIFINYRMDILFPFIESLREKDKELLLESLTHFQWQDPTEDDKVINLYAPLTFYSVSRSKNINVTAVPGMDSSLKEYFSTDDFNINCNILFYNHVEDVIPTEFLQRFYEMSDSNKVIKITNPFLNRMGINNIVITDYSLDQSTILNNQTVTFTALSEKYNIS